MISFLVRNLKMYFKDRSSVFFSLLAVFIIIGLYALFLGDTITGSMTEIPDADNLMNIWIMAGIIAVTSVTSCMGAFGTYVYDQQSLKYRDFYCTPLSRTKMALGYILSSYFIGLVMSFVALVIAQAYIVISGGEFFTFMTYLKAIGVVIIGNLTSTSIVFFIVSLFKSQNAFATASTIIGTLIGFLTGIYIPIGELPGAMQYVVKIFPISHIAALLRNIMMEQQMNESFANIPVEAKEEFASMLGNTISFGDFTFSPILSIVYLLVFAIIFFMLSILILKKKSRRKE